MKMAIHSLNYEGTFVYLHDNQLELMRIVHVVNQGGERERPARPGSGEGKGEKAKGVPKAKKRRNS